MNDTDVMLTITIQMQRNGTLITDVGHSIPEQSFAVLATLVLGAMQRAGQLYRDEITLEGLK